MIRDRLQPPARRNARLALSGPACPEGDVAARLPKGGAQPVAQRERIRAAEVHRHGARVVEVAAERSGWVHKKLGQGRALGFAAHRSFLSYVAAVVDVAVDKQGQVRIPRVDLAVDAGAKSKSFCISSRRQALGFISIIHKDHRSYQN